MPHLRILAKPEFAEARIRAGLNKVELARKSGLGRSHVQLIENGLRGASAETATKIAEVLGVPFDDIFKFERQNKEHND